MSENACQRRRVALGWSTLRLAELAKVDVEAIRAIELLPPGVDIEDGPAWRGRLTRRLDAALTAGEGARPVRAA